MNKVSEDLIVYVESEARKRLELGLMVFVFSVILCVLSHVLNNHALNLAFNVVLAISLFIAASALTKADEARNLKEKNSSLHIAE